MPSPNGHITWTNDRRKLGDLVAWEQNPRQLRQDQARRLRLSLRKFGYSQPIEIEPDNTIIDGHQRDAVMVGMDEFGPHIMVDVRVASRKFTLDERKEYIAQKHRGAVGEFDADAMLNLYDADELLEWGFDADEVLGFGFELEPPPPDDPGAQVDKAEELREKWGVESGQLWVIPSKAGAGEHRIICGDCTDAEVVARVMGGEKADIGFTSPPYNAGVSAKLRGNTSIDDNLYKDEYDDNQKPEAWLRLMRGFTDCVLPFCKYLFVNIQILSGNKKVLLDYWQGYSDVFCDVAIWDKGHAPPQLAERVMDSRFEFILIFGGNGSRAIGTRDFRGMVHNVYAGNPQRNNEFASSHAATFPVDFPEHFIKTFCNKGDQVLDPFLGSGTTAVACERLGRLCRGVEISPSYVAVSLQRLADMGLEPRLVEDD